MHGAQYPPVEIAKTHLPLTCSKDIKLLKSISVGWDNFQMLQTAKHHITSGGNKFLFFGVCYAVKHRLPSLHLHDDICFTSRSLPFSTWLPSEADFEMVRQRMHTLFRRTIVTYVDVLEELKPTVPLHIQHKYSQAMSQRSEVINLGALEENPCSIDGASKIMHFLQKTCPKLNDIPFRIPCNGDQKSEEMMSNIKRNLVRCGTAVGQLDGLVETVQEFHKEALLYQDLLNNFFRSRSVTDISTLAWCKEFFGWNTLKPTKEFYRDSMTLELALTLTNISNLNERPTTYKGTLRQKEEWLNNLATDMVDKYGTIQILMT